MLFYKSFICTEDEFRQKVPHSEALDPRILHDFWLLPQCPLLNIPSSRHRAMSGGVTVAILDRVSSALSTVDHQTTFSHSIRGDTVLSTLAKIRHTLFFSTESRPSPSTAAERGCWCCSWTDLWAVSVPAHLSPAVELPVSTPVQDGFNLPPPEEQEYFWFSKIGLIISLPVLTSSFTFPSACKFGRGRAVQPALNLAWNNKLSTVELLILSVVLCCTCGK